VVRLVVTGGSLTQKPRKHSFAVSWPRQFGKQTSKTTDCKLPIQTAAL